MKNTNKLLTINYDNEQPTVLSRDLHEALEVKSKYADWFKNMCSYGFEEGSDFITFSKNLEKGGRTKVHQLTIPMAKEILLKKYMYRDKRSNLNPCSQYRGQQVLITLSGKPELHKTVEQYNATQSIQGGC